MIGKDLEMAWNSIGRTPGQALISFLISAFSFFFFFTDAGLLGNLCRACFLLCDLMTIDVAFFYPSNSLYKYR